MAETIRTDTVTPILDPATTRTLLLEPVAGATIFASIGQTIYLDSPAMRLPAISDIDAAAWIPEGEEIPIGSLDASERIIEPLRIVGGAVVTRELLEDSSLVTQGLIGRKLADDIARKINASFFGTRGDNENAPRGLEDTPGLTELTAADMDPDGLMSVRQVATENGSTRLVYVASPSTVSAIEKWGVWMSSFSSGGMDLGENIGLGTLFGSPLVVAVDCPANTIYAFDPDNTLFVVRSSAEVEADESVFFTSYRIALRARMRATWAFIDPKKTIRFTFDKLIPTLPNTTTP